MNRFDEVVGPENWWTDFTPGETGVLCRLSIRLPDGQVITKADAGGYAGMSDEGDNEKSGFTDAYKRAAVMFGVGRYLYGDGVPDFAQSEHAAPAAPQRRPAAARTNTPPPAPGRQERAPASRPAPARQSAPRGGGNTPDFSRMPSSGRGLFGWAMSQKDAGCGDVMGEVSRIGSDAGYPEKTINWSNEQIADVWELLQDHYLPEQRQTVVAGSSSDPADENDIPF